MRLGLSGGKKTQAIVLGLSRIGRVVCGLRVERGTGLSPTKQRNAASKGSDFDKLTVEEKHSWVTLAFFIPFLTLATVNLSTASVSTREPPFFHSRNTRGPAGDV